MYRLCGVGKCLVRFGYFCGPKGESNNLDIKFSVFKIDDSRDLRLVQNLTMEEAAFSQIMRLTNQMVTAAVNNGREENLSPELIPKMSKKHGWSTQNSSRVGGRCRPSLQKNLCDSPALHCERAKEFLCSFRILARNIGKDGRFQQIAYVFYKLEDNVHLLVNVRFVRV